MVSRADICWKISPTAGSFVAKERVRLGENEYKADKLALQEFLAGYFDAVNGCNANQGQSIVPLGGGGKAKRLKVRWVRAGEGKSGGLRLAVLVYCSRRLVVVAGVWNRTSRPTTVDFRRAFEAEEARNPAPPASE